MTTTAYRLQNSVSETTLDFVFRDRTSMHDGLVTHQTLESHDIMRTFNVGFREVKNAVRKYYASFQWNSTVSTTFEVSERVRSHGSSLWDEPPQLDYSCMVSDLRAVLAMNYRSTFAERLDQHSADRLVMLIGCQENWDGQGAKALSLASLRKCAEFITAYNLKDKGVGVFMDDEGNLVLNWPISNPKEDRIAEITFEESGYAFYIDGWDDRIEFREFDEKLKEHLHQAI
ncbi:hypothetical protein [Pseudomonas sp. EpS/L25]|uniref:hypothetical protein n=1 Tax=Pseudomonas sp. EpS/L25 TaxID=1749078 RepID=UPI000A96FDA1|nr:hypothetical protein [Pseudomonas sp. EpS/L25]